MELFYVLTVDVRTYDRYATCTFHCVIKIDDCLQATVACNRASHFTVTLEVKKVM